MKKTKVHTSKNLAIPGKPLTSEEFAEIVKDANSGTFKDHSSVDEFKKDILKVWKEKYDA